MWTCVGSTPRPRVPPAPPTPLDTPGTPPTNPRWKNEESLQWHHNGHDGVSNHQPRDCLLKRLFRRRSKKTSKPPVTGLCEGNSPVTGEFPAQRASNTEDVSIWWRHHGCFIVHENISQKIISEEEGNKSMRRWKQNMWGKFEASLYWKVRWNTISHTAWWRHQMETFSE